MIVNPSQELSARTQCGEGVDVLVIQHDDLGP
jgi:hypothetical protein